MPWGTTCVTAIGKMLKNRLEDDEGIPVLLIKGSEMNGTTKDINHFKTEPEEFIDICEDARKTGSS